MIDRPKIAYCKIQPPLGIARVGDSEEPDGYFLVPERPGGPIETPDGPIDHDRFRYRDSAGKVKRQAARFRIYAYDRDDNVMGELTDKHARIAWTAHLANRKATWFGFSGAIDARAAFRGDSPPMDASGRPLKPRNIDGPGRLQRVQGGPHGHHYVADHERLSAFQIDGGIRSVAGPNRRNNPDPDRSDLLEFVGTFKHGTSVYLGELSTDDAGRLIVLGGRGTSRPVDEHGKPLEHPEEKWIVHYANNDDWHDDVSDGPITATVRLRASGEEIERDVEVRGGAWIVVAPPDFAPDVTNLVTLYDVMEEVAIEKPSLVNPATPKPRDPANPDLANDIWPIVNRSAGYRWTSPLGLRGHGQGKPGDALRNRPATLDGFREALQRGGTDVRNRFVSMVRPPSYVSPSESQPTAKRLAEAASYASATYMPPLAGDEGDCTAGDPGTWLTVTYAQHRRLLTWLAGDLLLGSEVPEPDALLKDGSPHPQVLTRAVLERCAGGAFYPGIEVTSIARDPELYAEAFRFDHNVIEAGDLTKYMALPWQADFYECRSWWWPAQRPDEVVLEDTFKELFAEFQAEQTGDLAGTFELATLDRVMWDRGVGDAFPRPADGFLLRWLIPFTLQDAKEEPAHNFADRLAKRWANLLLRTASLDGSPWRRQFLVQELLDSYAGRYYHLRASDPDAHLRMEEIAAGHQKLIERYVVKSLADLRLVWREAARDQDPGIASSLDAIVKDYDAEAVRSLTEQVVEVIKGHPAFPTDPMAPGSAEPLHAALTNLGDTVDRLDQANPGEVYRESSLRRHYAVVELRDALRDLAYLLHLRSNGDNAMVQSWRRLGFVVARTALLGDGTPLTVQVETERGKYDGANYRDQFYYLMNIQDHPDFAKETARRVEDVLAYAQSAIDSLATDDADHPEGFIRFDAAGYQAKLAEIYEIQRAKAQNYDLYYAMRRFNRESTVRGLLDLAPFNQCDGAWLRRISDAGPGDDVRALLFEVWSDEIGNGNPGLNHATLYTSLLQSLGVNLHGVTTRAYADNPDIAEAWYVNPVFQLAISLNTERFFPELLGMTLYLEWEVLSLATGIMRFDYLGMDSQFYRMHVGIDNSTNGHGAKARDAIQIHLDKVRREGGEGAVQEIWARIWRGFVAFSVVGNDLFGNGVFGDAGVARRRPANAASRISEVMRRKQRYGAQNHLARRLGPHRINDLFDNPELFQAMLAQSRWIVPGDPDRSEFFKYLTTFAGPMFKVFDDRDLATWRTWIEWLGREGDTLTVKRYYEKSEAMEKLLQELRSVAEGESAHARYRLAPQHNKHQRPQKRTVAEFFASGDVLGLMRALKDPENGWVVAGSPANSPLVADMARGGRPMGEALDRRYPTINNRIGRQILIEWVRAGCPIPGEAPPATAVTAEPLKSLGPKLLMETHGFGAVH